MSLTHTIVEYNFFYYYIFHQVNNNQVKPV